MPRLIGPEGEVRLLAELDAQMDALFERRPEHWEVSARGLLQRIQPLRRRQHTRRWQVRQARRLAEAHAGNFGL
jgi:hypothetical protein